MDILDDMGVSKLSAKVFFKVNYSFKSIIFVVTPSQWQSMRTYIWFTASVTDVHSIIL